MDLITKNKIIDIIQDCQRPTVTIYMPTYEAGRQKNQNQIRLKNLANQAASQLPDLGMGEGKVRSFLKPIERLLDDPFFWQEAGKGLALLLDASKLSIYRLHNQVKELLVVGNCFHIKPLIPFYLRNGEYYLLAIDQEHPKIFRGSKFELERIDNLDLPASLQEMFDNYFEFHQHLSFHTKTSTPNPDIPAERGGMFFSQSGGDDIEEKLEIKNFFHRFDDALTDFIGGQDIPLVLAGAGFLHNLYRQANTYPNLVDKGIPKKVDQMPLEDLHQLSWEIVKDQHNIENQQALAVFQQLQTKDDAVSLHIEEIVSAAYFKRIHTLLITKEAEIWGMYDIEHNEVVIESEPSARNEDLINFAASQTLINRGQVLVVSRENLPGKSEVAAIFHY